MESLTVLENKDNFIILAYSQQANQSSTGTNCRTFFKGATLVSHLVNEYVKCIENLPTHYENLEVICAA